MQSVVVERFGGPEVLVTVERPLPEPGPGEVRVRVRAAGVSHAEVLMRRGVYPRWEGAPSAPFTPGWDVVGTVNRLGPEVAGLHAGQRVAALTKVGGYSEALCLPAAELVPVPEGVDDAEAVCLVLNYLTAYQMLHRVAQTRSGEQVLIDGAAGGVGSALAELGRSAGVRVLGIASDSKHEFVASLGALPIDRAEDLRRALRRLAGGSVDVAFDGVGGWHLVQSVRAVRRGGRVVPFGVSAIHSRLGQLGQYLGFPAALAFVLAGGRRLRLYSISRLRRAHPDWFREDLATLLDLLAQRRLSPRVAARLPLSKAREAHELLERGEVRGRIVLTPGA
ncbi:MAG: medium chain dehydrogenase/reductase family protein [Myxococcales bacterium]